MGRIKATSLKAKEVDQMLTKMQLKFVGILESINQTAGYKGKFIPIEWLRNSGEFGGGVRYVAPKNQFFNGASVNFSQIQYESVEDKVLRSATALSTIIHPNNPKAPSIHLHVSYTEMKKGESYWRIMADLNPSIPNSKDTQLFSEALKTVTNQYFQEGSDQGDKYFFIPSLNRHRGVCHFYLERFIDESLAEPFILKMINCYGDILNQYTEESECAKEDLAEQLAYHTLYFYQVLTLDRGTTSGLLVHNENDIGILGSLPTHINRKLLLKWRNYTVAPQNELVDRFLRVLPEENVCAITDILKPKLAQQVREHYKQYPEALKLQASGNIVPPTVKNHS